MAFPKLNLGNFGQDLNVNFDELNIGWSPTTQPIDYIRLGGEKSPGIATVFGAVDERRFSQKQPPFTTGQWLTYMRREPAEFGVSIRLYSSADFSAFREWRKKTIDERPDVKKHPRALDIWHPLLEPLGIDSVVVKSVSQFEQTDDGEWTITIRFLEYIPIENAPAAPKKIEGSKVSEADPVDRMIDENEEERERLAQELARPIR